MHPNGLKTTPTRAKNTAICRRNTLLHTSLHRCGQTVSGPSFRSQFPRLFSNLEACGQPRRESVRLYCAARRRNHRLFALFRGYEADLSAKRTQAEEEARLPRPHGDACRADGSEAPPRQGAQAPLRVGVQRKNRLSRSRDFDAVYRHGRSVSTRFLTLYWFGAERRARRAAPGARRSEGRRQRSRPQPHQAPAARDLAREARRRGDRAVNDYVLVVRPGLAGSCRAARPRVARRARGRGARKGRRVNALRRDAGHCWRSVSSTPTATRSALLVQPGRASTTRAARSTRSTRCASTAC